jgi:hypothetical protein
MILKIKRCKDDHGWWLVDGVRRISASLRMKYETSEEQLAAMAGSPDVALLDFKDCNCAPPGDCCDACVDHKHYRVCRLNCRMNDGSDYSVVFDTTLYVLNDDGKTIEKIVANYDKVLLNCEC